MSRFAIVPLMLIAMLFAACGGDTPEPAGQGGGEARAEADAGSETRPQTGGAQQPARAPMATERASSPTGQGASASSASTTSEATPASPAAGATEAAPASGSLPTAAPVSQAETQASEPGDPDSLVPADPQLTDEVLLQDIYARVDLEQFALDPEEPIERGQGINLEDPLVQENPFLHLFPGIQGAIEEGKKSGKFRHPSAGGYEDISANRNGLINFIHHPWFHPIRAETAPYGENGYFQRKTHRWGELRWTPKETGPFWFGENSTKGVLLETVARLIEEAQLPGVEHAQRGWWKEDAKLDEVNRVDSLELRDWTLEEFLSISVIPSERTEIKGQNPRGGVRWWMGNPAEFYAKQNGTHRPPRRWNGRSCIPSCPS